MRWKFHASVIGVISVALLGGYLLFKPSTQQAAALPDAAHPSTQLRIQSASWGLNCNSLYDLYRQRAASSTPDPAQEVNTAPPVRISVNNVLEKVKGLCDAQEQCTLEATSSAMGEIFSDCSKELEVTWRCFNYDKLHTKKVSNGDTIEIDCKSN